MGKEGNGCRKKVDATGRRVRAMMAG